jgi:uncharacterized membrane protein YphA (DoxX/SURF4 family)
MLQEFALQRLFSTFANGLPGMGLMLQRFVISAVLMYGAVGRLHPTSVESAGPQIIDIGAGILLLAGLWTPVVGAIISGRELWIAFSGGGDPWMPLVLAIFGATLAMIGPGAWSLDARLFGRRQIKRLR